MGNAGDGLFAAAYGCHEKMGATGGPPRGRGGGSVTPAAQAGARGAGAAPPHPDRVRRRTRVDSCGYC